MSRLHTFRPLTKEQVCNSPSRRDGVPEKMEDRRRRTTALHLKAVSHKNKM